MGTNYTASHKLTNDWRVVLASITVIVTTERNAMLMLANYFDKNFTQTLYVR